MSISNKLKELFILRKGGGKTILKSGKRYILNKSGAVTELDNTDSATFDEYAEDPNNLLMLGDRGDLRQVETITRNLSVLFNSMVGINELYDVTPTALSAQIADSAAYNTGGLSFLDKIKIKGTLGDRVSFKVFVSNDNTVWEPVVAEMVHTFVSNNTLENVTADDTAPKYGYFKLVQNAADSPSLGDNSSSITGIVFLLKEIAVSKFFAKKQSGDLEALIATDYDLSMYIDDKPVADQKLYMFVAPQRLHIKQNFDGFLCNALVKPTAPFPIKVIHNGTEIGTMTVGMSGGLSFSDLARTTMEPSDTLLLEAASVPDASLEGLAITLNFERDA
jgi:hypothetical protein